jgi:hypothetical protein
VKLTTVITCVGAVFSVCACTAQPYSVFAIMKNNDHHFERE